MVAGDEEFFKTLKEDKGQGFSLIVKPKCRSILSTNKGKDMLSEVEALLESYKGIVVDELPNSLSPIRDISHHIDPIPGAIFPNKVAYKMTLAQNEEIAKKLQELLDKGLVRESLSPCVVPTVLAPKKDGK